MGDRLTLLLPRIGWGALVASAFLVPVAWSRSLADPFAEKRSPWPRIIFTLVLLGGLAFCLWKTGYPTRWWDRIPAPEKTWFFKHPQPATSAPEQPPEGAK